MKTAGGWVTKLGMLRGYMAAGNWYAALRMAARFPQLGAERVPITRGWEACARPGFYRQLGQCPALHVLAGIAALRRRYD